MQISFTCEHCGQEMEADSSLFGQSSSCPSCEAAIRVPQGTVGPGTTLGGFEVQERLGKGAMGEVFLARQIAMDRQVALKVLPAHFSADRERVDRFLHEARMSAKLDHPNIVTVLDAGEDTGYYYLAMQYVKGETLEDRMKRFGRLEEKEVLTLGIKIASGLQRAWDRHQMLHRDIKPANIMLDEFGEPKLLDMGLAKTLLEDRKLTVTGMIVGTPLYMSPEQGKGGGMDCRADVYSLGATLYTLLTGSPPYQADSVVAILAKHAFDPFPDPRRRNRELTAGCAQLLERMMGKEPDDRFQDWAEVIAAMKAVRMGRAPGAAPLAPVSTLAESMPAGARAAAPRATGERYDATVAMGPEPYEATAVQEKPRVAPWLIAAVIGLGLGGVVAVLVLIMLARPRGGPQDPPDGGTGLDAGSGTTTALVNGLPPLQGTPTPAVGDPQDGDVSPEQAALAARVDELLSRTDTFLARYPDRHDAIIGVLEELLPDTVDAGLDEPLEARLLDVQAARSVAVDETWERLRREAMALAEEGKAAAAIQALRDYAGPWAAATLSRRERLAHTLQEQVGQGGSPATGPSPAVRREVLDGEVGAALIDGDLPLVLRRLDQALADPVLADQRGELSAMRRTAASLADLPATLMQTYAAGGDDQTLSLRAGRVRMREIQVADGVLRGKEQVERSAADGQKFTQSVARTVTWPDLAVGERKRLLETVEKPLGDLAIGLLAAEVNSLEDAQRYFDSAAALPLANLAQQARRDLTSDGRNESAREQVRQMLRDLRLPMYEPFQLLAVTGGHAFSEAQRRDLVERLRAFQTQYGSTPIAREYSGILSMLAGLTRAPQGSIPYLVPRQVDLSEATAGARVAAAAQASIAGSMDLPVEVVDRFGIHYRLVPRGLSGRIDSPAAAFYLSVDEISEAQWERVTGQTRGDHRVGVPVQDLRPGELGDFFRVINQAAGRGEDGDLAYRLPTRQEWLYACLGGSDDIFYFDGDVSRLADYANHLDASAPTRIGEWQAAGARGPRSDRHSKLAPSGSYPANSLGLNDLLGNVAEYAVDAPRFPGADAPAAERRQVLEGVQSGDLLHLMGGNWFMPPDACLPDLSVPIAKARNQLQAQVLAGVGLRLVLEIGELDPLPGLPAGATGSSATARQTTPEPARSGPAQHGPARPSPEPSDFSGPNSIIESPIRQLPRRRTGTP